MKCLRARVEADIHRALAAVERAEKAGFTLGGQPYARPRSTPETPDALRPIYDCRSVALSRMEGAEFVADSGLPGRLLTGFEALMPMYGLLMEAVEMATGVREI